MSISLKGIKLRLLDSWLDMDGVPQMLSDQLCGWGGRGRGNEEPNL